MKAFLPGVAHAFGAPGRVIAAVWAAMMQAATVKVWAQIGAAMVFTVVLVGFGLVIWKGPWLQVHQGEQIEWLGRGMFLAGALCLVALVAITGVGLNFKASKDGVSADFDAETAPPAAVVETTTTTTVTPGA